jgi:hypothetical protein
MSEYSVVVFVHVVGAIVLVGATLFAPLIGNWLRRAPTVESLREWAGYRLLTGQVVGGAAVVVLTSGVYLAFRGGWWGSGWLEVSLALFAFAGYLALGVLDPAAKRLVASANQTPDGPVDSALDAQRRSPRSMTADSMLVGTDLTIVFLMTNKPSFVGAGVAVVVGLGIGTALAARERRHHAEAPAGAGAA